MRILRISAFAFLLSALAVLAVAGLGMTEETQPATIQAAPATMSNLSTAAPAPMGSHSVPPAQ